MNTPEFLSLYNQYEKNNFLSDLEMQDLGLGNVPDLKLSIQDLDLDTINTGELINI